MTGLDIAINTLFVAAGYMLGWVDRRRLTPRAPPLPDDLDPMSAPVPIKSMRPKLTLADFLGGIEQELDAAPDSATVEQLLNSARVADAKVYMKNAARSRLADWIARAQRRAAELRAEEAERRDAAADQVRDASWRRGSVRAS